MTAAGLRTLAQRCGALSGQVAPPQASVAPSGWQSTGAAATAVDAGAEHTGASLKARALADGTKVTRAAHDYETTDEYGAAALAAVGSHLPAGTAADGGAGGLGVPGSVAPLPLLVAAGADGGAGGLGGTR